MREAKDGPGYVLTAEEAMEMAARNGRRLQPPRRYVCVGWDKQWVGFRGWAIPHETICLLGTLPYAECMSTAALLRSIPHAPLHLVWNMS